MARLYTSGFELQSATAGMEYLSNNGTTPTISTTTVRSGAAALRFNPTAATSFIQITYAAGAVRRVFVRFAVRFASFPTVDMPILQFWDGASAFPSLWLINSTKTLRVRDGNPADVSGDSAALSTGVWYVIQFDYDDTVSSPTTGPVNAYLNGTQFATNVPGWNIGGVGDIRIGLMATATADMFIDDIAVNDTTGSSETGLPDKDGKVVVLLPDSAGDNNLWPTAVGGTAGAANNFTRVDEIPPDDATSYNQLAATGTTQIDDFNVASSASAGIGASDTIKLVGVGIRTGSTAVTAASIVSRLKGQSGGTTTESSSINVNVNGWRTGGVPAGGNPQPWANIIAYTNPQTSTAWTTTSLDSMQIGYRANTSQTTTRRVSAVWATVEYVPVVATNAPATEATGTGSAADASVSLSIAATEATGTGAAADAGAAVTVAATEAAGTGVAYDATVTTVPATNAPAAEATGTGTAFTASTAVAANAAEATGTGAAQTPQAAVTIAAAEAAGTGSAHDAVASAAVNADAATGTGAAQDATVSTSAQTNAPATEAAGTGSALDAAVSVAVSAAVASGTGSAAAAAVSVAANAGTATGTGAAADPTVTTSAQTNAPATEAIGSGSALDATAALGANAGAATGTGTAYDATVSTTAQTDAPATEASGTGAAYPATVSLTTFAGVAAATGAAHDATTISGAPGTAFAGVATGTGQAFDARVRKVTPRPYAGVTPRPNSGTTTRPYAGVTQRP